MPVNRFLTVVLTVVGILGAVVDRDRPRPPARGSLWTAGLLLLVFPWSDSMIDLIHQAGTSWPTAYLTWQAIDVCVVLILFASGRMWGWAVLFALLVFLYDRALLQPRYESNVTPGFLENPAHWWGELGLIVAAVSLVTVMVWVRTRDRDLVSLWSPFVPAFLVAFLANSVATAAYCEGRKAHECTTEIIVQTPRIDSEYFSLAAQVIPALLIALTIEEGMFGGRARLDPRRRSLIGIAVLAFVIGEAAALTALAAGRAGERLPMTFPLSVEAIVLGFGAIFALICLRHDE